MYLKFLFTVAKRLLEMTHKQFETAGINLATGMHEPDVDEPPPLTPNAAAIVQQTPLDMFTKGELHVHRISPMCYHNFFIAFPPFLQRVNMPKKLRPFLLERGSVVPQQHLTRR